MAGRPTKLTPEIIEKAKQYILSCTDTIRETDRGSLAYVEVKLPKIEDLALFLGVARSTVYEWQKIPENGEDKELHIQFSDIIENILTEQASRVVDASLGGLYNPKIAGILLSRHGYIEEKKLDVTTKGRSLNIQKYTDEELERLAEGSDTGTSEAGTSTETTPEVHSV